MTLSEFGTQSLAVLLCTFLVVASPYAGDRKDAAEKALSEVLFDFDTISENLSTEVTNRGVVNVEHNDTIEEEVLNRFLDRLRAHPDIGGVNADIAMEFDDREEILQAPRER